MKKKSWWATHKSPDVKKRKRKVVKDKSIKVEARELFYVIATFEVKAKTQKELIKKLSNGNFKINIEFKRYGGDKGEQEEE